MLSVVSVRGLLFALAVQGPNREQLRLDTGFPLFMWGPGITTPNTAVRGDEGAPTSSYCTIHSMDRHSGQMRGVGVGGRSSCQKA